MVNEILFRYGTAGKGLLHLARRPRFRDFGRAAQMRIMTVGAGAVAG
ncbi:hypothetical protein L286_12760 [Sphingobium sp. HDIP04]|nr:hypothetical protein L286_12760 [Sphingobium sp. HDIP04]